MVPNDCPHLLHFYRRYLYGTSAGTATPLTTVPHIRLLRTSPFTVFHASRLPLCATMLSGNSLTIPPQRTITFWDLYTCIHRALRLGRQAQRYNIVLVFKCYCPDAVQLLPSHFISPFCPGSELPRPTFLSVPDCVWGTEWMLFIDLSREPLPVLT